MAMSGFIGFFQPGKQRIFFVLAIIVAIALATAAFANRVPTGSSGTAPVIKTFPGALTMQIARTGTAVTVNTASGALNAIGGVTSAQLSPSIAATTEATIFDVSALGCTLSAGRCANRGTITVQFSNPVTNPVLHISGLGGNQGTAQQYHASLVLTSFTASGTPTLTRTAGTTNFTVNGSEIRAVTVNGGTSCTATTVAGCGSVRVNGTVSSLTFQVDLLTAGSGTPTAANVDTFSLTASVDEDFGDAPAAMESAGPASHVVGNLYLGSGVTADNSATTNAGTQASPNSSADASLDGGDDGVAFPALVRGTNVTVNVAVNGAGGLLQGWIDWGDDGNFATAGDRIATNAIDGGAGDSDGSANGVIALSVAVPSTAALTETIARFRYSSVSNLNFTGLAPDGEVEDYAVTPTVLQADLSLTKTVSNAAPNSGAAISYVLTVTNSAASQLTATGVTVTDVLPAGFAFVSATGTGTYNNTTGLWTVGSIAPGISRTLTINGTVDASSGATVTNSAEVTASSAFDLDSTPNNGVTSEDDYASVAFTVAGGRIAGTPPTLNCTAGTSVLDWDNVTWTAGQTSGSYALTAIGNVTYDIAISGGVFLNNATYGGQAPARQNVVTGGLSPAQYSIFQIVDFTSQAGAATNSITLPTAVPGAQFRIFDVDFNAGQFADRVTITGSYNGTAVTPTVTNGVNNYVIGNSAYGDGTSPDASGNGNVVVTFTTPVDTITMVYGNHSAAPTDPGQQAIALHDITFCRPTTNLTIAKTSSLVSDPTNGTNNPKAIPGATMLYCILVTNNGSGTATSVTVNDPLPSTVTFVPGSLRSGTSCAGATTVEDDDNIGADESDPFGASTTGTTVSARTATLVPNAAMATTFNATIK